LVFTAKEGVGRHDIEMLTEESLNGKRGAGFERGAGIIGVQGRAKARHGKRGDNLWTTDECLKKSPTLESWRGEKRP